MKTSLKKLVAVIFLMTAISCTKEPFKSNSVQSSRISDKSSGQALVPGNDATDTYASVQIGTQKFMTKNLSVTHYRNGDRIPQVKGKVAWGALTTGAWCWYNNDSATYAATYGRLYNWYAVHDPRGLAPTGWHIPSDSEWTALSNLLGGAAVAGGKMKSTGTIEAGTGLWSAPNTGATNSSGFTGLPGGYRNYDGTFNAIGSVGHWWSSTENNTAIAWYRFLVYDDRGIGRYGYGEQSGFSVRCLRD